ncbi:MAG: HYR domain-containing protein [Cyanothece sp. SIO1E1]|nr:HYR domain-containing protein [Cyanothece sp. SIO1E1]
MKQKLLLLLFLLSLGLHAQTGTLDVTFDPGLGVDVRSVWALALQPDGKIMIGGDFLSYNGTTRNGIARVNADGSLDTSFDPGTGIGISLITSIAIQPDGKIFIVGQFTAYNGTPRNRIARLNADGSLDTSFDPGTGADDLIWDIALRPDGKIIIVGNFVSYNGTTKRRIARLNADGSLDNTFNPGGFGVSSGTTTLALQPDGKIIIGGFFTSYNLTPRRNVARVNEDGSLDTSFDPGTGASSGLYTSAVQPDGKIIIGGQFSFYNGTERRSIARLNANGSLDTSFDPGEGIRGTVYDAAVQPDGKIIIGGAFVEYNETPRSRITRVNADGSLDNTLDTRIGTGDSGTVWDTAIQPDGKIIIGGFFSSYDGTPRNGLARLLKEGSACEPTPITCPADIVTNNDNGDCGALVSFSLPDGATATPPSGSFFPVGTTTVEVEGSDGCDGTSTCSFTVTINDTEAPTIKFCPLPNVNLNNTNDRCGAIIAFGPTPEDNCPGASIEQTEGLASGSLFPIGSTTVVFVATDAASLTTECRFTVNVKDNQAPIAVCKDVTVEFNGETSIDLTPSEVWNQAASSDNCGNVYYAGASPSLSISCDDLGNTVPLTVTIHDGNGNMDNCTADVTVTGLPCGWSEGADDGSLNCPGDTDVDYDVDDESFSMSSDGCWQGSHDPDKAAYVYQELCGDGTLTARLASINTAGYAGLMLRETLDPESRRAGAVKDFSTRRVRREYRSSYGGSVARIHSNRSRVKWFRIVRKGNEIKSYTSTNGSYWRLLYRVVMPNLDDCVYIGMMAYSKNSSSEVEAVFDNVSFSGSGSSLIDNNNSLPNSFTAFDTDLEIEQPDVNIFPNPSNGQSQIELNGFQETPAQIMVRDAFGKVVRQIEVDYPEGTVLPLDLQDMPAGLYLISVMQDQQQVITKKLMIQK